MVSTKPVNPILNKNCDNSLRERVVFLFDTIIFIDFFFLVITAFCIYQRGGVPGMGNKKSMSNRDSFIDIAPPGGLGINDVIRPIDDIHSARASSLVSIIQEPDEQLSLSGETLSINHSVYYHSQTHQEILKKYQSTRRHRDEMRRNRRKRPKQLSNRETLDPYEAEGKF